MLRVVTLEEIQGMLLRIPGLVDIQERRDPGFVSEVKQWLTELEKLLDGNRIPEAGNVAALRGVLISAERGVIPTGIQLHGKPTGRKIKEATAAALLRQVGDLVSNMSHKDTERVAEAVQMSRHLVARAKAKDLIQELPCGQEYTEMLKAMWRTMSQDPDLSAGTVNVEGLVGPNDALIILDRTVTSDMSTA